MTDVFYYYGKDMYYDDDDSNKNEFYTLYELQNTIKVLNLPVMLQKFKANYMYLPIISL